MRRTARRSYEAPGRPAPAASWPCSRQSAIQSPRFAIQHALGSSYQPVLRPLQPGAGA
jgi:hypothetical protein